MKKILFISNSLGLGGSEKCMQDMINRMDTNKYDITVLALIPSKAYVDFNKEIKVINGYENMSDLNLSFRTTLIKNLPKFKFKFIWKKFIFSINCKKNKNEHLSKYFWKIFERDIPKIEEYYDAVIGYGQGNSTYFLKNKVTTKNKIAWLNTDLVRAKYDIDFVKQFYQEANSIVTDSENGQKMISELYPEMSNKTKVFRNIMNLDLILKKGDELSAVYKNDVINILSIGRLVEAKAFHLAIEAANVLKNNNIKFQWNIIGDGGFKTELIELIKKYNLQNNVILLGLKTNPYPFLKECDYYVQTSIYEGSCITISEAMIFNKPIVTTNFESVYEKIEDGKNGLICEMDGIDIADKIMKLINDQGLKNKFIDELKANPIDYTKDMKMLDSILEV